MNFGIKNTNIKEKALSREKIYVINIGEYRKMNSLHEIENLNREHTRAVKLTFGFLNL